MARSKTIELSAIFFLTLTVTFACVFDAKAQSAKPHKSGDTEIAEAAATHLELAGAILTRSSEGHVIGFQLPENMGLRSASFQHLAKLTDLEDLQLCAMHLSNERLKLVGDNLSELRTLNLFGNPLDSISLSYITKLQKLETLYLYRTFIDDEGMDSIMKLKSLKRLNVFDTFLTDEGLRKLGNCKHLTHLCIGNSRSGRFPRSSFTFAGIEKLRADLPNTTIVYWGESNDQRVLPAIKGPENQNKAVRIRNLAMEPTKIATAPNIAVRKTGHDWPSFLGSDRNGKSRDTGLNTEWNSNPPKVLWHKRTGTGFSAPSVHNGRLILYERLRNEKGPERFIERLSCLHSETGDLQWKVDYPTSYQDLNGYGDGPRSTPLIDGDRVFILSPEGILRSLQCVDGKLLWEVNLKSDFNCDLVTFGVGTSPLVYGNRLIVIVGGRLDHGEEAGVIALDKRTGVFDYGVGKGAASYASPIVRDIQGHPWCFAFTREGLMTFDPRTGRKGFEFPWKSNIAGAVNAATPVILDDEVLISEAYSNGCAKLKVSSGVPTPIWRDQKTEREKRLKMHWATPILHDGFLFGCSGRHTTDGVLKCVAWKSGDTMWQKKMPDRSSMVYCNQHLISLGENGTLTLIKASPEGYQEIGRLDKNNSKIVPSYPAWTAPTIARGLLYVRGKHELICYELSKPE